MRVRRHWLCVVLCVFGPVFCAVAQDVVPSRITAVTVYFGQALVTREAQVKVGKGLNEFYLSSNAFQIDNNSLSLKVFGQGSLYGAQIRDIYRKESPQEKICTLEEKIDQLRRSQNSLYSEKEVISKKDRFLSALIDFSQVQIPHDVQTRFPTAQELRDMLLFLDDSYAKFNKKNQELDIQIDELDKEITVLQRELDSLRRGQHKTQKTIAVMFNADKDQTVRVSASYVVPAAARWKPLYKADVPSALDKVNLTMCADISQKTGEEWADVSLSLSNAIPLRGMNIPEAGTWFLTSAPQYGRGKGARFAEDAVREMGDWEGKEMPMATFVSKPAGYAQARRSESALAFEYQMPSKLSIESKDETTLLPLSSRVLKGDFYYYAVPLESQSVFLVCRAETDNELLSGVLNISFEGRFLGTTFLQEKKTGEEFLLNLGETRDVKVKKEQIKDKVDESFFGKIERKTVIREKEFKITVENLRRSQARLHLFDALPVSRTDKIEVKDVRISLTPDEQDYNDKKGVLFWDLTLQPGEKKEIVIGFTITYPNDLPVFGL